MRNKKKNILCFLLTLFFMSTFGITSHVNTASALAYKMMSDPTTEVQKVPEVQSPEAITVAGSGSTYDLDFASYNPMNYDFRLPIEGETLPLGRASNPMQGASGPGTVESLSPKDLALGQIVPFEVAIKVSGDTSAENGTIKFSCLWDTITTNKDKFGFDSKYMVYAAFVDYGDPRNIDSGKSASAEIVLSETKMDGSNIKGTIEVSGLDNGDVIIVEMWVVLQSTLPTGGANGNVQSRLDSAQTSNGKTINTGDQTVPLKQLGEFITVTSEVGIVKVDRPDPLYVGDALTYTITVTNSSPDVVANGIIVTDTLDPNVTYKSATDWGTNSGGVITWPAFALEPGGQRIFTVAVNVNTNTPTDNYQGTNPDNRGAATAIRLADADVSNIVQFTMITQDSNLNNNVWQEPTNILPRFSVTAYKVWVGGPASDHKPVVLTLYRQIGSGAKEEVTGVIPTIEPSTGSANRFTYTWSGLPMYDSNFQPYIYSVDELAVKAGYEKTIGADNTITNTYKPSLIISKVYGETQLQGAVFELYAGDTSGPSGDPIESITTGLDGKATFQHLVDGVYWIVEAKPPTGYKYINDIGPITVANGEITGPSGFTPVADGLTGNYILTVPNEPIRQLPATGGTGVIPFTLGGLGLMTLAISMKRRKKLGMKQ